MTPNALLCSSSLFNSIVGSSVVARVTWGWRCWQDFSEGARTVLNSGHMIACNKSAHQKMAYFKSFLKTDVEGKVDRILLSLIPAHRQGWGDL